MFSDVSRSSLVCLQEILFFFFFFFVKPAKVSSPWQGAPTEDCWRRSWSMERGCLRKKKRDCYCENEKQRRALHSPDALAGSHQQSWQMVKWTEWGPHGKGSSINTPRVRHIYINVCVQVCQQPTTCLLDLKPQSSPVLQIPHNRTFTRGSVRKIRPF